MKRTALVFSLILTLAIPSYCQTNDFYDDAETIQLGIPEIEIVGEIENVSKADFSHLSKHSLIVKETRIFNGQESFIGAYRYDGYSLFDILNNIVLKKNNADKFPPVTDLYVEVENAKGEKTVISWGEIYYPSHLHEIIIATQVSLIVPTKTKNKWPLPSEPKLIVGSDLFSERNLVAPKKIAIRSYSRNYNIKKGMHPMFAPQLSVFIGDQKKVELETIPNGLVDYLYPSIFYGRGTGIHKTTPFQGKLLKEVLNPYIVLSNENYTLGFLVISGKDGYHAVFSFSEIFNRNDQAEFLIYTVEKDEDDGKFKIFPSADFFSDRAIKSVEAIYFELLK